MPDAVDLLDAFAAGFYLLFAITHFDLWRRQRGVLPHLWLTAASLSALTVDVTGLVLRHLDRPPPYPLEALNTLAVAAATVALHEMTRALSGRPSGAFVRGLETAALAIALAGPLLAVAFPLVAALCAVLLALAIREAFHSRRIEREGASWVAGGFLVLALCLLADLAMEFGLIPKLSGLPALGFAALFLASARALAERFEAEQRELAGLRAGLEQRVEERTAELEEANRRLAEMSLTDELTGLPNRRGFLEAAGLELHHAERNDRSLAIVLADVDRFKTINDTHGHATGDEVLREVAILLREALREQDLVARWGGEEFILLLPDTDRQGAVYVADLARRAFEAHTFTRGGVSLSASLSLGVAEHRPGARLDATLVEADRALYRAKEAGRNRVETSPD
jgi:diguanylate cyclase (GGDEF)-like protein